MIAILARIRTLSRAERRLIAEAAAVLAVAALMIALFPFRRVAGFARRPEGAVPGRAAQLRLIGEVRWAVAGVARRVPWRAKCLEQGFAAQWMLRRRSVPAILHYGVARKDGGLVAHAWVSAGSVDVVGCENKADFTEMARFPPEPQA